MALDKAADLLRHATRQPVIGFCQPLAFCAGPRTPGETRITRFGFFTGFEDWLLGGSQASAQAPSSGGTTPDRNQQPHWLNIRRIPEWIRPVSDVDRPVSFSSMFFEGIHMAGSIPGIRSTLHMRYWVCNVDLSATPGNRVSHAQEHTSQGNLVRVMTFGSDGSCKRAFASGAVAAATHPSEHLKRRPLVHRVLMLSRVVGIGVSWQSCVSCQHKAELRRSIGCHGESEVASGPLHCVRRAAGWRQQTCSRSPRAAIRRSNAAPKPTETGPQALMRLGFYGLRASAANPSHVTAKNQGISP